MKKVKQVLALLLVITMLAAQLSGCSKGSSDKGKTNNQESGTAKEETGATAAPTKSSDKKEVFKLAVHTSAYQGDWNNYWLIKEIEEKFNVDIQVDMISNDVWTDKLPLMFSSNDIPDFFLNSLSDSDIVTYGGEGYLLDLSQYISKEKTPNIYAAMEETPALKAACTQADGKIYSIYGADMQTRELAMNRFFINKDWANKILGKQPETLDEFYQYLKGVKEKDMNGNGKNDEIPLGGYYEAPDMINIFTPILAAFGYTQRGIEAINDKVVYVPAEDNYKAFLTYMNKLYTEGLLDKEFFSQTEDQCNAKETNHLYGAYCYYASWVNQPDEKIWKEYDGLDPMTSQYNSTKIWSAKDINKCGNFIITKNCSDPEKLMEIADWLFTFDGLMAVNTGYQLGSVAERKDCGYTYEWLDDKKTTLKVDTFYPKDKYDSYYNFAYAEVHPDYGYFPMYRTFSEAQGDETQKCLTNNIVDHYAKYYHVGWPTTIKYTSEEADELSLISTDIKSYTDEMITKFITGEASLDQFDTFRKELKNRKLDRMIEINQAAYDRWKQNQ